MNEPLDEWLNDVLKHDLIVSPDSISKETKTNCWSFSFSKDNSIQDIVEFFEAIHKNWSRRVTGTMTFYVWQDEMAHQLRCCIASVTKQTLPFGQKVNLVSDLENLVEKYYSSNYSKGIPFEELAEIPFTEVSFEFEEEVDIEIYVWCHEINPILN